MSSSSCLRRGLVRCFPAQEHANADGALLGGEDVDMAVCAMLTSRNSLDDRMSALQAMMATLHENPESIRKYVRAGAMPRLWDMMRAVNDAATKLSASASASTSRPRAAALDGETLSRTSRALVELLMIMEDVVGELEGARALPAAHTIHLDDTRKSAVVG
jgi:hypothetical protein